MGFRGVFKRGLGVNLVALEKTGWNELFHIGGSPVV